MPDTPVPWVGLAAWWPCSCCRTCPSGCLTDPGPASTGPRRHVCGDCGAPWIDQHTCSPADREPGAPLRGELRRRHLARRPS
jgi:hypothetical protein